MRTLKLCSGTFLLRQVRQQHTTQTHSKHHHHGGGAACPFSDVDLINPRCPSGGRPCAYILSKAAVEGFLLD
jgi:hypothetical protein